jgi:RimJ/RimL family protein N-acetyltransferase
MPAFDHSSPTVVIPPLGLRSDDALDLRKAIPSPVGTPLSRKVWGLDFTQGLPCVLSNDGIEATAGELDRVLAFMAEQFPSLTEEVGAKSVKPHESTAAAKQWYLSSASDLIELRHEGQTVGVLVGAPEDWGSYYVRIFAMSPAYQRPGLIRRFARQCLFGPLRAHHVERVVADTSPANLAMTRLFSELRFHVTGHQLSDRWGPLVRYTKFLDPACESAFCARFAGSMPRSSSERREP